MFFLWSGMSIYKLCISHPGTQRSWCRLTPFSRIKMRWVTWLFSRITRCSLWSDSPRMQIVWWAVAHGCRLTTSLSWYTHVFTKSLFVALNITRVEIQHSSQTLTQEAQSFFFFFLNECLCFKGVTSLKNTTWTLADFIPPTRLTRLNHVI